MTLVRTQGSGGTAYRAPLSRPDKKLPALWGPFCPGAVIFIATHKDHEKLKIIAEDRKVMVEKETLGLDPILVDVWSTTWKSHPHHINCRKSPHQI
jgi:hypothetical protein